MDVGMKEIRGHEDVACIAEKSPVVIWGAGKFGYRLLQEIMVNKVKNVYIFDMDEQKTKEFEERMTLEHIIREADKMVFIISVQDARVADEIAGQIRQYGKDAEIYRYVPKDWWYLEKILTEKGFFNGVKRCKQLDNLSSKKLLEKMINGSNPFLCSRWGGIEGDAVYAEVSGMFNDTEREYLKSNAGFWPINRASIHRFAECLINAAKEIDILIPICTFGCIEDLYRLYSPSAALVTRGMLSPFWSDEVSWTDALKGKKVLVIHPFAKLMEKQWEYRDKLFRKPDALPEMDLKIYQAVQSLGGSTEYESWFDALEKMQNDISGIDFDVAIIGCGAYGMPLGAFIKSQLRKKAIHIGGTLQLFFGIKGQRWDNEGLYNEYWVRPTDDLKPKNYKDVEDGCYW